jgi:hypothetical protein
VQPPAFCFFTERFETVETRARADSGVSGYARFTQCGLGNVGRRGVGAYLHALNRCIELAAASVAERMLLEGEPVPCVSDVEHTMRYASLVCRSPEAADRFIRLCETMADDLLRPYGYVLIALSTVLRIRRTLSGEEIDSVIATTVAGFELAAEQARRKQWRRIVESAAEFDRSINR